MQLCAAHKYYYLPLSTRLATFVREIPVGLCGSCVLFKTEGLEWKQLRKAESGVLEHLDNIYWASSS